MPMPSCCPEPPMGMPPPSVCVLGEAPALWSSRGPWRVSNVSSLPTSSSAMQSRFLPAPVTANGAMASSCGSIWGWKERRAPTQLHTPVSRVVLGLSGGKPPCPRFLRISGLTADLTLHRSPQCSAQPGTRAPSTYKGRPRPASEALVAPRVPGPSSMLLGRAQVWTRPVTRDPRACDSCGQPSPLWSDHCPVQGAGLGASSSTFLSSLCNPSPADLVPWGSGPSCSRGAHPSPISTAQGVGQTREPACDQDST